MSIVLIIYAIFFGIIILSIDIALSVGMVMFWRDGARMIPVIYALTEIAITAMYIDSVVRAWIE